MSRPKHRPVGAYLPVGQLDGDCACGRGAYPCPDTFTIVVSSEEHERILDELSQPPRAIPELLERLRRGGKR